MESALSPGESPTGRSSVQIRLGPLSVDGGAEIPKAPGPRFPILRAGDPGIEQVDRSFAYLAEISPGNLVRSPAEEPTPSPLLSRATPERPAGHRRADAPSSLTRSLPCETSKAREPPYEGEAVLIFEVEP